MASTNDITGDKIISKPSQIDQSHWESIFGSSSWDKYMAKKKEQENMKNKEKSTTNS
jgi:hypothetical protein